MTNGSQRLLLLVGLALALVGCSGSSAGSSRATASSTASPTASGATTPAASAPAPTPPSASPAAVAPAPAPAPAAPLPDPNVDGPYLVDESDDVTNVAATGDRIPIHAIVPRAGSGAPGPYPVVVLAHGFQVPASQYFATGRRIATFGYVVLHPEYPTSLFGQPNHAAATLDLIAVLDWALAAGASGAGPLAGKPDGSRVAIGGHSLGAKLGVLAAAQDPRFRAVFLLDPVDAVPTNCLPGNCPQARAALPLAIPTLVLGETLDATPGFFGSSCAPATDNFAAFFAKTSSPSLQVVIPGAAHMSFIDDTAACGVACFVCKGALIPQASVLEVTRSFTVAFLERHLKGTVAYDEHLTGATAQSRWVATGRATLTAR